MGETVGTSIMRSTMPAIVTNGTVYCLRRRHDVAVDECLGCSALTAYDADEIRCTYSPATPPWRRLWNAAVSRSSARRRAA